MSLRLNIGSYYTRIPRSIREHSTKGVHVYCAPSRESGKRGGGAEMGTEAIVTPGTPEASDKAHVGGKGANLGLLTDAGFAVPPWFCVSTSAHRQFVRDTRLEERITEIASAIDFEDLDQAERETARIRK